jgi:hypothetical protein
MWRDWLADVTGRLDPLLPTVLESRDERTAAFAHRGEPEAAVRPAAGGQLSLTGVKLSAWEGIHLPRKWSDLAHGQDKDPCEQLADFVECVCEALHEWKQSLVHLLPPGLSTARGGWDAWSGP